MEYLANLSSTWHYFLGHCHQRHRILHLSHLFIIMILYSADTVQCHEQRCCWNGAIEEYILLLLLLFQVAIIQEEEFYNLSDEQKKNIVTMEFESDVHTESVCLHYVC